MPRPKKSAANNEQRGVVVAAVRDVLNRSPRAKVSEIVGELGQKGIKTSSNYVYFLKRRIKKEKRKHLAETQRKMGITDPVQLILKVKSLAGEAGGIRHLKQLVDALAE